ncbi:MAG: TlpA family protein disulfide reductase [Gammaproteobacteria bacterium]|nr:TlpA family protein disulfide reductase [Gammaproteobacteria bacterium]
MRPSYRSTGTLLSALLLSLLLALPGLLSAAPQTLLIEDDEGVELPVSAYPAEGEHLILWLLPQQGERPAHAALAKALNRLDIEVWQVDLLDAHFLARTNDNMRDLSGVSVASLLRAAHQETGKQVMIVASGRPAITALRGMRQWQRDGPDSDYVLGTALYFPNLMQATPVAGEQAIYVDEAYASNLPVLLMQPEFGVYRWHLEEIIAILQQGGAPVFSQLIGGVRDFYYLRRNDPEPEERLAQDAIPAQLQRAARLFARMERPLQAAALPQAKATEVSTRRGLVRLDGSRQATPIALPDQLGKQHQLKDYDGNVILLNFWASWCPPCVEEIPSMNRMAETLGEGFAIVSVNFQEDAAHIQDFMRQVQVDFPVLMDSDGRVSAEWKVFAFPSSFILDRQGRLRYSVNSAIDWEEPEVLDAVRGLMAE